MEVEIIEKLKQKKIIAIIVILAIILSISLLTYGKNKSNVFKDEYMKNIFVEEDDDFKNVTTKNDFESENTINTSNVLQNEDNKIINTIVVEIKGEVKYPDVYTLNEGSIIKDLIEAAGGLTTEADISNINRAKEVKNHELIIIRNINDVNLIENLDSSVEYISEIEEDDGKININTADMSKLKEIPGVGEVKANAIIVYREKNNGFKSIDELKNIDGIGDKTFEKIKSMVKL